MSQHFVAQATHTDYFDKLVISRQIRIDDNFLRGFVGKQDTWLNWCSFYVYVVQQGIRIISFTC